MNEARRAGPSGSPRSTTRFIPQQFSNPANPEIHRRTTAEEIWRDTDGEVDVFVAGVGTGGTITGVGQVLKERDPDVQVVARRAGGLAGALRRRAPARTRSRASAPGFVPEVLDRDVIDEIIARRRRGRARRRRALAAQREGLLVGISAGAAIGRRWSSAARPEMAGKRIVVIVLATRASATCRCRSSPHLSASQPELRRVLGLGHCDACSRRSPPTSLPRASAIPRRAAIGTLEILTGWAGVQALLAHRVAHALWEAGVPLAPRAIAYTSRAVTGIEIHPGGAGSAPTSSSTTAAAW